MKISIIVPVYNVEKYLSKCLKSLINQTLEDIEIICINDGSTDKSLNILEEYANNDNRIKVINQENQGVSVARNNGISVATGDYITFVDSDDWLELNTCEEIYNKIIENNSDVLLYSHYDVFPKKKIPYNLTKDCKENILKFNNIDDYIQHLIYVPATTSEKLYKKEFLDKINTKFRTDMKVYEDTFFWFSVIENCPQISILNKPLYNYLNLRESSALNKIEIALENYKKAFKIILDSVFYTNVDTNSQMLIYDKLMNYFCWMWIKHRNNRELLVEDLKNYMGGYKVFDKKKVINLRNYKQLRKNLEKYKFRNLNKILASIFSIKNNETKTSKIITILGFKINLKLTEDI